MELGDFAGVCWASTRWILASNSNVHRQLEMFNGFERGRIIMLHPSWFLFWAQPSGLASLMPKDKLILISDS